MAPIAQLPITYNLADFVAPTTIKDFVAKLRYLGFSHVQFQDNYRKDGKEYLYMYAIKNSVTHDFELCRQIGKEAYTAKWLVSPDRDYSHLTMHQFIGRMIGEGVIDLAANRLD